MNAGPELNALVHEKIFGNSRHETEKQGHLFVCKHCEEAFAVHWTKEQADARFCRGPGVPAYSTEIDAAWAVWETFPAGVMLHKGTDGLARVVHGPGDFTTDFHPAPLAICLSALRAAGVTLPS